MSHSDINLWDIRVGDVLDRLREMPDESVHCCVTSPPYFGLRDYGTGVWEGGDPNCDHGVQRWEGIKQTQGAQSGHASKADKLSRVECSCGAHRVDQQIGLEPSPEAYITKMVEVFAGVRRVLRPDGTLWLNIGDSYAGSWGAQGRQGATGEMANRSVIHARQIEAHPKRQSKTGSVAHLEGIKAKDLIGIPWMLAFALRADGWYLRSDIVWAKPNPMPESVTDRPTKSHEYLFLLSKSKKYYYDAEAVSEPVTQSTLARISQPTLESQHGSDRVPGKTNGPMKAVGPRFGGEKYGDDLREESRTKSGNVYTGCDGRRNRRTVWNVATQPFKGAHFATFPPKLIEPCILAGSPVGGVVLDPFVGAGTTLLVATQHNRASIGIELNPEYAEIARQRLLAPPKPKKTSRKKAPSITPPPSLQPLPLFIQ